MKTTKYKKILNTEDILDLLSHGFSDKRMYALDYLKKMKNIDDAILEELLHIASSDMAILKEKARDILRQVEITPENFVIFTKLLRSRTSRVQSLVLKKLLSSPSIDKERVIPVAIKFLYNRNNATYTMATQFLKENISNKNKWIRELVPKLRRASIEMRQDIYEILGRITPIHPENSRYLAGLLMESNRYVKTYARQAFEQIDMRYNQSDHFVMDAFSFANPSCKEWILRGLAETDYKSEKMILILQTAMNNKNTVAVRKWGAICAGRMRRMAVPLIPELENLLNDERTVEKEARKALDLIR